MIKRDTVPNNFEIPRRPLGTTGEKVSIIGLGGAHIGFPKDEKESIKIIRTAIDAGINFMDNSWDYNDGISEQRMGQALQDGYREKVFLMTKLDGRSKQGATRHIDESLQRLKTDRIDLMQIHEVIHWNDPELVFAVGGAIEALMEAKQAGKIRFIGFTGHKSPDMHLKMLRTAASNGFRFDTVQMPLNVLDFHFDSFEQKVLPILRENNIGIIGMKPLAEGRIVKSKIATATEGLRYAMSLPVSVTVTGCDSMKILEQAIGTAGQFQPLTAEERTALLAKTAAVARDGRHEQYKTGTFFDATTRNPHWLA
jgi:aryl-alcohol dehydrogenase-like predicted oxidoreductase